MRRLFWLAMGVTIGVLVVRRLSRVAERMTPSGVVDSFGDALGDLAASLRDFAGDVRDAMSAREIELREGTGLAGSDRGPADTSTTSRGGAGTT
jgi:hypothetical protein